MKDDHLRNLGKHVEFFAFRPAFLGFIIAILLIALLFSTMFTGITQLF